MAATETEKSEGIWKHFKIVACFSPSRNVWKHSGGKVDENRKMSERLFVQSEQQRCKHENCWTWQLATWTKKRDRVEQQQTHHYIQYVQSLLKSLKVSVIPSNCIRGTQLDLFSIRFRGIVWSTWCSESDREYHFRLQQPLACQWAMRHPHSDL